MQPWWHEFYALYGPEELFKALIRGAENGLIPPEDIDLVVEYLRDQYRAQSKAS